MLSIMSGLNAEPYDRNYSDRELVRRILGYFKPKRGTMLIVGLMLLLTSLADAGTPILISRSINQLVGNPTLPGLLLLAGGVLALGVLSWCANFVRQTYSARAVGDVILELRKQTFNAVVDRDMSFFDNNPSGKIVSRVTTDTDSFANLVTLTMNLISQVLLVIIIAGALFYANWRLALLAMTIIPVILIVAFGYRRIARQSMRKVTRIIATLNSLVQETISGIAVAKNFRQERTIYTDFSAANGQAYQVILWNSLAVNIIFSILDIIGGIGIATMIYFGGMLVLGGTVTIGEWFLFVTGMSIFLQPISGLSAFWSQLQAGLAAGERIFALIDVEPKVVQTDNQSVEQLNGQIEFKHIQFSYKDGEVVLPDFSLTIPAGETVALVGHTGAGKTSVARLIARFYEFQAGSLLVDGRDIRTFDLQQYRRRLGIVSQVPFLFAGSVADNIRYGRPDASDEEVERAARQIGAGALLDELSQGLKSPVGERGVNLSTGQRQLVALARVLLQNPAICILDEATANVDLFTETQIQEGLDLVLNGRTSIVIAHRLSTIYNADRIIVLREGRIVEQGTHTTLLADGGHYAELYNTYFRHQAPEYIERIGQLELGMAVIEQQRQAV